MTSDGTHYIDQQIFKTVIEKADDANRAAERLLALARWLGGPDNASIKQCHLLVQKPGQICGVRYSLKHNFPR